MQEQRSNNEESKVIFEVNFNNPKLCRSGLRDEVIRINTLYDEHKGSFFDGTNSKYLKLFNVNALESDTTTFTITEINHQFNLLKDLQALILQSKYSNKDHDLKTIEEYKVVLLNVIYDRIRDPELDSHILAPSTTTLPWYHYKRIWNGIKSVVDTFLKYLQFIALGLTKWIALLLPIFVGLAEAVPYVASLFSIPIVITASPAIVATLTAAAAIISLISVYYYLPYLLQWIGITSPHDAQDKSLVQIEQEKCVVMGKINNRLEQTLLNLNSAQYKALANVIIPVNQEIIDLKTNPKEHKQSRRIKIVRAALTIFNVIASAHSAIGIANLFNAATLITSGFLGVGAAASLAALLPIIIPVTTAILFIGLFSWAQFLVSATVLNALDPEGAAHTALTKDLKNFHAPSPEKLKKICNKKIDEERIPLTQEQQLRMASPEGMKKMIMHTQMRQILQNTSVSNNPSFNEDNEGLDHTSIGSLWKLKKNKESKIDLSPHSQHNKTPTGNKGA